MGGKHRKRIGIGDLVLFGAFIALVLTIAAFALGIAGSFL